MVEKVIYECDICGKQKPNLLRFKAQRLWSLKITNCFGWGDKEYEFDMCDDCFHNLQILRVAQEETVKEDV